MKFKGDFKKIRFFATIGLSAMAMVVATIGTFAWFQARSSGADPRHEVTADSAGLDITGVTAYKATFAKKNASTYDYSKAAVGSKVYMGDGEANTDAQHSGDPLNVPTEGCGYYLMGDETFCAGNGLETTTAWKFASSIHMLDKSGKNHAYLGNVTLVEGMTIDIMYHTYGKLNSDPNHKTVTINEFTANWATTTLWWQGGSTSALQAAFSLIEDTVATYSTQMTIKSGVSGVYDLWLTSENGLSFVRKGDASSSALAAIAALSPFAPENKPQAPNPKAKGGPTIKKAASQSKNTINIYIEDQKNGWNDNQYFSYGDNGVAGTFRLKITSCSFASGSGYSSISDIPTTQTIIGQEAGTYVWRENTYLLAAPYDQGWGTNIHKWYIELPWIFSSITYTFTTTIGARALNDGSPTATAGKGYTAYLYHDRWADNKAYFGISQENNKGATTDSVAASTVNYYNAKASTSSSIKTETILYWQKFTPASVSVPGYTFNGWYWTYSGGSFSNALASSWIWVDTDDKSVYGDYTAGTYAITFNKQDGTGGSNSATATYGSPMPSATAPTRTGYVFGGYYTKTGGGGTQYYTSGMGSARNWDLTSATTLYAKWTAKTVTITFNRHDGSGGSNSATLTYGSSAPSISVPTRTGYTFQGYYSAAEGSATKYFDASGAWTGGTVNTFVTANYGTALTGHARWELTPYTITLKNMTGASIDGEAVVGSDHQIGYTYGTQTLLQGYLTRATKDGYVLSGFYDNEDLTGNPVYEVSTTDTGNKTYWAQWIANADASKLYIENQTNAWANLFVNVTVGGSSYDQRLTPLTVDPYTNVYYLVYPSNTTKVYAHNGNGSSGGNNRTGDIGLSSSSKDSYGNSRGTQDIVYVHSDITTDGYSNRKWAWGVFPGFASPGYYLVGSKNYSGAAGGMNWSYASALSMTALTAGYYEATLTFEAGDEFQIWHATASNNRANIYNSGNLAADAETGAVLEASGSNIRVRTGKGGKYHVYIDASDDSDVQISIVDAYAATYAVFNDGTKVALMKGDGTYNTDVLESGIDIAKDKSFVVYRRSQGTTTWITGAESGYNPSDTENAKYSQKTSSTSSYSLSYDDLGPQSSGSVYGVQLKMTGTYTIYVSAGKIYLASVPKENGYFLLHEGGSKGYTSATEFLTINNNPANATDYVAQYSNYIPTSGETAEIHSYIDGKDTSYTSFSRIGGLTSSDVSFTNGNETVTFGTTPFNIYIQKNGTVVFEKQASVDMLTMNSFDGAGYLASGAKETFIRDSNTTLVLAVEFSVSQDFANNVDVVCTAGTDKIRFTAFAFLKTNKATALSGHTPYSYMRANKYSGWANCTAGSSKSIGEVTSSTTYIVLIMIDYNPNTIDASAISSWVSPNASFALKAAQS